MTARDPPPETNSQQASTFGPIDPAGNSPAASSPRASDTASFGTGRAAGVPKPSWTYGTSVRIACTSAPTSSPSAAAVRSLSTTDSTPP